VADKKSPRKRRGRLFRWFERAVLGIAISMVTFVLERRLRKALGRVTTRRPDSSTVEVRR
jgi:hypothetical protein